MADSQSRKSRKGGSKVTPQLLSCPDGAGGVTSGPVKNMAEEEKPREEPKQDSKKTTKNGGYTIPAQMS
jgi:hypothetical protein